jgi:hypothetical protein
MRASCKMADGETDKDDVFDAIWADLATRSYTDYYYYRTETCSPNLWDMLLTGDGRCGAWRSYMIALDNCHGIAPSNFIVQPTAGACNQNEKRFFVKNLTHVAGKPMTSHKDNLKGLPDRPNSEWPVQAPNTGIPGQRKSGSTHGTPHKKRFSDHALVEYTHDGGGTKLYDPSYGASYAGANDNARMLAWQNAAIDFFGVGDLGGGIFDIIANPGTLKTQEFVP